MFTHSIFIVVLLLSASFFAPDQDSKTIQIVVPFVASGATHALAHRLAKNLTPELGHSAIVEKKPGASAQIGTVFVKSVTADGLTCLFTVDQAIATLPHLVAKARFDPLKDLFSVGEVA